ncbi:polyunsaturated fatty acid 5-lipoxygenase-like [Mobula hypostoma]|uniref:polyunsaturated fatty acid 5-lipoxygenase-like n=1 Tax=Mobula hypostoma TaxID=723540 RepID=UPI002FC32DEE
MVTYKATFRTGTARFSGTDSTVHCTLIGEHGKSHRTVIDKWLKQDLERCSVDQYDIPSDRDLGSIWFVELEVTRYLVPDFWFLGNNDWLCCSVTVEGPSGKSLHFPCYRWLDECTVCLREGTAKKFCDDKLAIFHDHRQEELRERQRLYRWRAPAPNLPRCIDFETVDDLPMDLKFNDERQRDFQYSFLLAMKNLRLKRFVNMFRQSWSCLEDFDNIFWSVDSPIAVHVKDHWKEDWFFGYQFLNGCNPVMIRKCSKIPDNFPVTDAMVQYSLGSSTLQQEVKDGKVFIVDWKMLDGLDANIINGEQQCLAAPICLLHLDRKNRMMPLAIQLKQTPGVDNPIFLPSDTELDWLLAKMWVRTADFQYSNLISHLLNTHLLAETFCVATIRQLPSVHPIYKLLLPHTKYTMHVNTQARQDLIGEGGIMSKLLAIGTKGRLLLSQREFLAITYQSLCLPDALELRGVADLEGYYYKDDGLRIWSAILRFVDKVVTFYYHDDEEVKGDPELQAWITDITEVGLQDLKDSGIPTEFCSRSELSKFLTMVIFTCTVQHAAVNNPQFDWEAWVPNSPCTMRRPPPTAKGSVTMEYIMASLPDISQSSLQMSIKWVLSQRLAGMIPLGNYVEGFFTEEQVKGIIREFQEELKEIDRAVQDRNEGWVLKYDYLQPVNIENSITI